MINAYALDRRQIEPTLIQEVAEDLHLVGSLLRPAWSRRETAPRIERPSSQMEPAKAQPVQLVRNNRPNAVADDLKAPHTLRVVPQEFFVSLREALIDAMGPMAHIVLSEHIKLLGGSFDQFGRDKIDLLIDSVSREIFDQSIRAHFRENMSAKLNAVLRA